MSTTDSLESAAHGSRDTGRDAERNTEPDTGPDAVQEIGGRVDADNPWLGLASFAAAIFALVSVKRARHAELVARQTRSVSEQARREAEGLLGFLTDDFVSELQTFGRYQTIAELSQREIDYFQHLPAQLKDPQTIRSGALALMNHANALSDLGDLATAGKNAAEAVALLESLRRTDRSEAITIALGRAYQVGSWVTGQQNASARTDAARAIALLQPIARRPGSSVEARRAYAEALNVLGWQATSTNQTGLNTEAVEYEREAIRLTGRLGGRRGDDPTLATDYATAAGWLTLALANLGRNAEALRAGKDGLAVADQVLAQRPQYGDALIAKEALQNVLSEADNNALDPPEALHYALQSAQTGLIAVRLEPRNTNYVDTLAFTYGGVGVDLWEIGRLHDSLAYDRKALDAFGQGGASLGGGGYDIAGVSDYLATMVYEQALLDDPAAVSETVAAADAFTSPSTLRRLGLAGSYTEAFIGAMRAYPAAALAYERGDFAAARRIAAGALASLQAHRALGALEISLRDDALYRLSDLEGHAEYALGAFEAATQAERTALDASKGSATYGCTDPRRTTSRIAIWLSMSLARAGHREEAARTIGPVVAMYRSDEQRNHGDQWLPLEYAEALYAQSLTDARPRPALLREATARVDYLIPAIAVLHGVRQWRARIEEAERATGSHVAARSR